MKKESNTDNLLSRKDVIRLMGLVGTIPLLSACEKIINPLTTQSILENTPIPSLTQTLIPTQTTAPTSSQPEPSQNPTPTETPIPEVYNWDFVSQKTDEEIFSIIGVPNPEDYELTEELQPSKILRNEGGQSYALFQNKDGIDLLAENLETKTVEHAIYAEYENGVPLMILTDNAVVEKDNGWLMLNEDYGQAVARDRLAESFNRGLSFTWWEEIHPKDIRHNHMYSLNEIPEFEYASRDYTTRSQRRVVSDYILERFKYAIKEARENDSPLVFNFHDRNRAKFDAAKGTFVLRTQLTGSTDWYWQEVMDGMTYNKSIRSVTSITNGSFVTLSLIQQDFMPSRNPIRPVGGLITNFIRYFFGSGYFQFTDTLWKSGAQYDMTGPILENMCKNNSIPSDILNFYDRIYPASTRGTSYLTENCAVVFGK